MENQNLRMFIQWIRVRALPPNGVMPLDAFGCVYAVSTGQCTVPVMTTPNPYHRYNFSEVITVNAPPAEPSDPVQILVDGSGVASGTATASFNVNTLSVGTHTITAKDTNTLASITESLNIWRAYNSANIILPDFNEQTAFIDIPGATQLPETSWNSSNPGILYIDTSNNLDEYLYNGVVVTINAITPLYDSWIAGRQLSNTHFIQGPGAGYVVMFGTKTSSNSGNVFIEVVNLTSTNVIMIDGLVIGSAVASDVQVNYLANSIVDMIYGSGTTGTINNYDLITGQEWSGGSLSWFIMNNAYWVQRLLSVISVEAGGSSSDRVQQVQLSNTIRTGHPTFTSVASYAWSGAGAIINGVDGVEFDTTTNSVEFQARQGYGGNPAIPTAGCCHDITVIATANSASILQQANTVTYPDLWPALYDTYGPEFLPISTSDGYALAQSYNPGGTQYYGGFIASYNPYNGYVTATVNPFVGGYTRILIPAQEQWIFNSTRQYDCLCTFFYNNSNYGIAPASDFSLYKANNGNIIWYWNTSKSEFPDSVTFTETGLPNSGQTWNVMYDGNVVNAVVPNSILIHTGVSTGSFSFSVPSNVVGGSTYTATPSSGTANVGTIKSIMFTTGATCGISLSNTVISFGQINPGSAAATANLIVDTNFGGSASANILVDGSSWLFGTNSFYVSNTLWASTSSGAGVGNPLMLDPGNLVDAGISIGPSANNNIFFGVLIPPELQVGVYAQNIVIENKC